MAPVLNDYSYILYISGSGKSLIYQLPAVYNQGKITIVISPLIALIKDQIHHLLKNGINGKTLNHKMNRLERSQVISGIENMLVICYT